MSETERMSEDLGSTRDAADALSGVLSDLEARSQSFGRALSDALAQATVGGRGLDTVLRGLALRLSGLALDAGLKPLQGLLSQGISGLLGGASAGGGRVTPFAKGGVISTPAYFPLGGGTGLAGEAGAEAILPLRRGADGTLGVASGGGGETRPIVFNVTASDADSFLRSEAQIATMLSRSVARGGRNL